MNKLYHKKLQHPTLIEVFNNNEENSIAVYRYIIEKDEDVIIAYPQSGEFILKIKNSEISESIKISDM